MTKIYELHNHILIDSDTVKPYAHQHKASHIIISLDKELTLYSGDIEYLSRGFLIPSGVQHNIETNNNKILVFLYDNTTNVSKKIRKIASINALDLSVIRKLYSDFEKYNSIENYKIFENYILNHIGISTSDKNIYDERISKAIEYIKLNISEKLLCRDIANKVYLSESRFSHLFKKQIGMTFSSYIIYQRIIRVYTAIIQGKSITEAAINAGFYSSSHFADVNHRIFGLSATDITKNMIFKKII